MVQGIVPCAPSPSASASAGLAQQAAHTEHQDRQVDEGLKRDGCAVDAVAQPPKPFQPAEGALDDVALPLQRGVLAVQLACRLLSGNASSDRNEGSEPALLDKAAKAQAVVPLVG
jgi:hypothetical protein